MAAHDFWTDRLSEHLDGALPPDEARAVSEHLDSCDDCRRVADELAEVRRRARVLGGIEPPADLWAGIRARMAARSDVVDLTLRLDPPLAPRVPAPRRSGGFLRVAAVAAVALGAGTGGWALRAALDDAEPLPVAAGAPVPGVQPVSDEGGGVDAAVADEVAALERLLARDGAALDPNTLRVLRKNLTVIQTAVAESRAALEADPDNAWVRRHLDGAVERQRAFVRQATALLAADD